MHGVIVLERGKTHGQRTALAERAQAHVHANHETVRRGLVQHRDDFAPDPIEILLVGQGTAPVAGVAARAVNEDEIDVGRKIEFAPTELAHAEYQQLLGAAMPVVGPAETGCEGLVRPANRAGNAGIGEIRQLAHHRLDVGPEHDVAPGDTHHLGLAQAAQCTPHGRGVGGVTQSVGEQRVVGGAGARAGGIREQRLECRRPGDGELGDEGRSGEGANVDVGNGGVASGCRASLAITRDEDRGLRFEAGRRRGRQGGQGGHGHRFSLAG